MTTSSKPDTVRALFAAFRSKDRATGETLLTDDFTFTSPYDDHIDKAAYFARCWPNADLFREHVIETIAEDGDEVFALYRCVTTSGKEFRNTEVMSFRGGKIKGVAVYFGATWKDGVFLPQAT